MTGEANLKPYDFDRDFKNLSPEKRAGVMETARVLLKIQRKNKAMIISDPGTKKNRIDDKKTQISPKQGTTYAGRF
jgi:hypothetical protein